MKLALSSLLLALVTGCGFAKSAAPDQSGSKDLAANKMEKNVALFLGAPTNLTGVPLDISKNEALFNDSSMGFGFNVTAKLRVSKSDILSLTRQAASSVGDGGTLLWYFSGHGMENGAMYTEDGQALYFSEVADAIKGARSKTLKRLVVVIDNCFAGTNLEGQDAIIPQTVSASTRVVKDKAAVQATMDAMNAALKVENGKYSTALYEQALVMVASQASETSLDGSEGGIFSEAWRKTLKSLHTNSGATLGDMAKETTKATAEDSGGHHTPMYRAYPSDQILSEPLFGAGQGPNGGGNGGGGSSSSSSDPIASNTLFAALAPAGANGEAGLYLAGGRFVASVKLCRGLLGDCWRSQASAATFVVAPEQPIDGMSVFRSSANFQPVDGEIVTILAYDASQKLIEGRSIRFVAR